MFGVMMAALVYFESTSSSTSFEPVLIQEQPRALPPTTDFDKEYQEFLKKGKKAVSQETLDSLSATENSVSELPKTDEPANQSAVTSSLPSQNERKQSTPEVQPSTRPQANSSTSSSGTATDSDRVPENVENSLQTVEVIPPPVNESNEQAIGVLEEVSPEDYNRALNQNRSRTEEPDGAITEEFYVEETISGRISALSDGTPIAGAKISIIGTDITAVSDSNGRYSITVPGNPEHRTIRYSYQGSNTERDVDPGTSVLNIRF